MLQAKKAYRKKRNHSDSDSDEDDDYRIFVAPTDVGVAWRRERQAPRRSLPEHTKKTSYSQEEELEREDEKYQNEVKEMNEERKDENEVLGKIELITGGRYRPVGAGTVREA